MTVEPISGAVALIDAMARTDPKRVFIHGENNRLTYGAAVERITRLTGLFKRLQLAPGARVVLASRDDLALAAVFLALIRNGLTAVVLNPESRATELANEHRSVANVHMDATEHGDGIVFMHTVKPGPASRSYGLQVAQKAGVPREVIETARAYLQKLEKQHPK